MPRDPKIFSSMPRGLAPRIIYSENRVNHFEQNQIKAVTFLTRKQLHNETKNTIQKNFEELTPI